MGSHSDVVRSRGEDPRAKVNMEFLQAASGFHVSKFIPMDCRQSNSRDIIKLSEHMKTTCDALRKQYGVVYHLHQLFTFMSKEFDGIPAVRFEKVQGALEASVKAHENLLAFTYAEELHSDLCELNDMGYIIYLKGWIVLDQAALLSRVQGVLFAPANFKQHCELSNATGVVPVPKVAQLFRDLDTDMLVQVLSYLEFCCEICDLLHLAFSCAMAPDVSNNLPFLQRKCSIWKNGIYWGSRKGVEALVEIRDPPNNTEVVVMLRCMSDQEVECARLCSTIIQMVLKAKEKFCHKIPTKEFLLHHSQVNYPFNSPAEKGLFGIREVSRAVLGGEPCVVGSTGNTTKLEDMLLFEPYLCLGEVNIRELFDEQDPAFSEVVSDSFLYRIAKFTHKKANQFCENLLSILVGQLAPIPPWNRW